MSYMRDQFEKAVINLKTKMENGAPIHTDEMDRLKMIQKILDEKFEGQRSTNAKDVTPKKAR